MNYNKNLVIIDADSIVYIIASKAKVLKLKAVGVKLLDDFIKDILISTKSNKYLGFFGKIGAKNFRYDIAVTKPYKGNRKKDKEDWYVFWEPLLKERMEVYWGFIPVDKIEADDAVCIAANFYRDKFNKVTVSSPDKDLLQIENMNFYNYFNATEFYCTADVAQQKLAIQMLMGNVLPI